MKIKISLLNAHFLTLAELFTDISAGFFGLIFLAPLSEINFFSISKDLILGLFFYYLAVKIRREANL